MWRSFLLCGHETELRELKSHTLSEPIAAINGYDCRCRQIPGYPRVDRDNSFLSSRFDGAILDAKAWGPGMETPHTMWPLEARNATEAALRHLEVCRTSLRVCSIL